MSEPDHAARLADPSAWSTAAARLLANLGFSLIHSDRPGAPGGSHLLIALRATPTLRHFDPERVSVWVARGGGVGRVDVDGSVALPFDRPVLWGHVHVIDRLGVENRFLSFGGRLRAAREPEPTAEPAAEPELTVVDLTSPGPIVRWGGHSQGTDPLTGEIGAFFGRLILPVDFTPGAELRLAGTAPLTLYAGFVADLHERLGRAARTADRRDPLATWAATEANRLRAAEPGAWAAGPQVLAELGLRPN